MTTAVQPGDALPVLDDAEPFAVQVDDVRLGGYAWWQPSPAPAIVLIHGWGQDASHLAGLARQLHGRGWNVLSLAARGWPGSTGDAGDYGLSSDRDIPAVVSAVHQRGVSNVWLLGYSAGGLQAARGVVAAEGVAGVITVNSPMNVHTEYRDTPSQMMRAYYDDILSPAHWERCSPVTVADQVTVPMLLIAGTEDRIIPCTQSQEMAALVPSASYVEMPGMRHLPTDEQWDDILARALGWIEQVGNES